jgi:hypothetical protein
MDRFLRVASNRAMIVGALAGWLATSSGCAGLVATLMYRGNLAPVACTALEGKRVAVVCTAGSGDFGPNPNAGMVARRVGQLLAQNVKEITLIPHQEIESWMDEHDVEFIDYVEIGHGVKADVVVGIDIESLRLQDGQTLYKGQANYKLAVIDVKTGNEIYAPEFIPPLTYPKISGMHTASIGKEEFRQQFIAVLSADVAKHFYAYDMNLDVAPDAPN